MVSMGFEGGAGSTGAERGVCRRRMDARAKREAQLIPGAQHSNPEELCRRRLESGEGLVPAVGRRGSGAGLMIYDER